MTDSFRTDFFIPKAPYTLGANSRVLTMGSCFSDVIGYKLQHYKVQALVNPFGTIFNPVSAGQLLEAAAGQDIDIENRLVERDGLWYAYDLHSSFAAASPELLLANIEKSVAETGEFLKQTDLLILTFGTAIAYKLKDTGEIVANCHKIPASQFDREMLTPDEIVTALFSMHAALREINPKLKIVLTVSPVRHVKESMVINSASKATLRVACHYLSESLPDVQYFPSFELMMDDLRDYRFYKADMLHPTEVAENYIWQKFTRAYFDEAFRNFMPEWDKIKRALLHKPFQPESPGHQRFLKELLQKLKDLQPSVNLSAEIQTVREQLIPEPETQAGKHKKKKRKPGKEEREIADQAVAAEVPAITRETAEPEPVAASPANEPATEEPAIEETQAAATEPEVNEPAPLAPEKPALTEAEPEAIANRPIVPAKPWMSAKEKAEARKKEREAQQEAKRENKKKKHKQKKAAGLVTLLTGIKSVAETNPAETSDIAAVENQAEQAATTTQPGAAFPPEVAKPVLEKAEKEVEKPLTKEKPAAEEKNLAISAFLQNLTAPKPAAAPGKPKKQPAKRKPKAVAKKQPKAAIQPKTSVKPAQAVTPAAKPEPAEKPAPVASRKKQVAKQAPPEKPALVASRKKQVAIAAQAGTPKAATGKKATKLVTAPEPAPKPKRQAPARKKPETVAAPEPAIPLEEKKAKPKEKKAKPKKPAAREKTAETTEKIKPKPKPKSRKAPKPE